MVKRRKSTLRPQGRQEEDFGYNLYKVTSTSEVSKRLSINTVYEKKSSIASKKSDQQTFSPTMADGKVPSKEGKQAPAIELEDVEFNFMKRVEDVKRTSLGSRKSSKYIASRELEI